ncbi:MAG: Ig-like domain-containing protein [Planctomycetes bacterium]|nr:Ig-like domain-containing protein [Planctomycetota bacterium]
MKRKSFLRLLPVACMAALAVLSPRAHAAGEVRNVETNETFTTLKAAIDDADTLSGHTLRVEVPLLNEGLVTVHKDLTIRGLNGTEVILANTNTGSTGDARAWFLVNSGITLHVEGLTFDGNAGTRQIYQVFRHKGGGSFNNCTFRNVDYPSYQGSAIVAFGAANADVDVRHCTFENISRVGILYFGTGITNSVCYSCTFIGQGNGDRVNYGVEVGAGAVVQIQNSTFSDYAGITSNDGSTSAGVAVSTFFAAGTAATLTSCSITGSAFGLAVGFDTSDTSAVTARYCAFEGNSIGVASFGPLVDAAMCWWGDATGPEDLIGGIEADGTTHIPPTTNAATDVKNANGLGNPVTDQRVDYTPWTSVVPLPLIGLAKEVTTVVSNSNNTFDVTFTFTVENMGTSFLEQVQVTDDLLSVMTLTGYSVLSLTSADLSVNAGFDGESDIDLLDGSDILAPDEVAEIVLKIRVQAPGTYHNTSFASGDNGFGTGTTDRSTNSDDPDDDGGDPSDDNNGNPSDNSDLTSFTLNAPPTANNDAFEVLPDTSNNVLNVLGNDSTMPDTAETLTITTSGATNRGGSVSIAPDGLSLIYTPAPGFTGMETFTYTVSDGNGGTDSATVTVNVTLDPGGNSPPVATNVSPGSATLNLVGGESFDFEVTAVDADGDILTFAWNFGDGTKITGIGATQITKAYDPGIYTVTVTVTDGNGGSDTVTFTVFVTGGVDDTDLYVAKGAFKIDFKAHAGTKGPNDAISFAGNVNPAGLPTAFPANSEVEVTVNDEVFLGGHVPLNTKGQAKGAGGGGQKFSFKISPKNGKYALKVSKDDLRAAFPEITDTTESGVLLPVRVRLEFFNTGMTFPAFAGQPEFLYSTKAGGSSSGKFAFKKNRLLSGAYIGVKTSAKLGKSGGYMVASKGYFEMGGGGAVVPDPGTDITLDIGGTPVTFSSDLLTQTAKNLLLPKNALPGLLLTFNLNNPKKSFVIQTDELTGTGIPDAAPAEPTFHNMPLRITMTIGGEQVVFETIIELLRKTSTSTSWKR